MSSEPLSGPVGVARGIYWVGRHEPATDFHCNAYLLVDEQEAVLIDPGSIPDFPVVFRKVLDVVGPESVTHIVASHQDPDVCGNLGVVEEVVNRADLKLVATPATHRLLSALGLQLEVYDVAANGNRLVLQSGRVLEFIPTPYLHSPGAMVTLDPKTGTAFTSDLFGALSLEWELFARPGFAERMGPFHREYMPANSILRPCIERLEKLKIERICPQHGSVLEGAQVHEACAYLKELRCGLDLAAGAA